MLLDPIELLCGLSTGPRGSRTRSVFSRPGMALDGIPSNFRSRNDRFVEFAESTGGNLVECRMIWNPVGLGLRGKN